MGNGQGIARVPSCLGVSLKYHGRKPYDAPRILHTHERSVVLVQSSGPLISMAREARAVCKGQAVRCSHIIMQGTMRGINRELAGKCACAGAPMISSAVVRAVVCWRGGEAILTSRQPAQTICISQGAFRTVFFYSVAAGLRGISVKSDESRRPPLGSKLAPHAP